MRAAAIAGPVAAGLARDREILALPERGDELARERALVAQPERSRQVSRVGVDREPEQQ
jgi:hypothetical protein